MKIVGFHDYYNLPEQMRSMVSYREWAFMPDSEKQRFLAEPTESDLELEEDWAR